MTIRFKKRLPATVLNADREVLRRLGSLEGYNPRNPAYSIEAIQQLVAELDQAERDEVAAERALEIARARASAIGWQVHDATLGVKLEVVAQFGEDSPAVMVVGRKPKSDRRRPARRTSQEA